VHRADPDWLCEPYVSIHQQSHRLYVHIDSRLYPHLRMCESYVYICESYVYTCESCVYLYTNKALYVRKRDLYIPRKPSAQCAPAHSKLYPHLCRSFSEPYGVASISRLLKITGLFCRRALLKRRYSAKETYIFKEPTNCSHHISRTRSFLEAGF